jgi:hypothetical protein
MREIPLTQGQVAQVSDDAYERVMQYKWQAIKHHSGKFYASGWVNGKTIKLHNFLMQPPPGFEVDHIDRNGGLNCQWENMRLVTSANNAWNRGKRNDNSSGFKGVHQSKWHGKYRARVYKNGVSCYSGHFDRAEDAARAYDKAACEYHGEFASLNFPDEWEWDASESKWKMRGDK